MYPRQCCFHCHIETKLLRNQANEIFTAAVVGAHRNITEFRTQPLPVPITTLTHTNARIKYCRRGDRLSAGAVECAAVVEAVRSDNARAHHYRQPPPVSPMVWSPLSFHNTPWLLLMPLNDCRSLGLDLRYLYYVVTQHNQQLRIQLSAVVSIKQAFQLAYNS